MAISIFPSTAAEFVSNNFVVDMNDTSNNTADTGGVKQAGPYSISLSSGDSSFDIYFVDEDGNSVGYSNTTSIVASGLFSTVVILGVAQDEVVSFLYQGSVNNADGEGDEPGAGAYLESISPSDLPSIDDTATVTGGNFGANTEITFESGATVLPAKSITVVSGTELLVTRPDGLVEDDSPYDLKAINTGVTPPSSIDFVLTDAVTAGSDPTWVTTSPLNSGTPGVAFTQTLEATDSDGTVTDYSVTAGTLTPGLTLNASTGVLSGTPTTGGNFTFTVTATDDGGNSTPREFELPVELATGGTVSDDGGFRYHAFTSTDDFEVLASSLAVEYIAVAGGGGGGAENPSNFAGGGGGAGGLLNSTETLSSGTITMSIGAGGSPNTNGTDTTFGLLGTAIGGGRGVSQAQGTAGDGGSGGAGVTAGSGTPGQGNDGGSDSDSNAGGGGAGQPGENGQIGKGGDGSNAFASYATATGIIFDGGYYAGGGAGGSNAFSSQSQVGGLGGGGGHNGSTPFSGLPNSGGGGSGSAGSGPGAAGGSGLVIVRYAF